MVFSGFHINKFVAPVDDFDDLDNISSIQIQMGDHNSESEDRPRRRNRAASMESNEEHEKQCDADTEALIEASKNGNLERISWLIEERGLRPDIHGFMGWTPGHWAAREGHLKVIKYLYELGSNLDAIDDKVCYYNSLHNLLVTLIMNIFRAISCSIRQPPMVKQSVQSGS